MLLLHSFRNPEELLCCLVPRVRKQFFCGDDQDKLYHPAEGANFLLGVDMTF